MDMESDFSEIIIFFVFVLSIEITCHVLGGDQSETSIVAVARE